MYLYLYIYIYICIFKCIELEFELLLCMLAPILMIKGIKISPVDIHLFKVIIRNTGTICEICLNLTKKIPK